MDDQMLSFHAARICACGAGIVLPIVSHPGDDPSSMPRERFIIALPPLYSILASLVGYTAPQTVEVQSVRCLSCGEVGHTTHLVTAANGYPMMANRLAADGCSLEYGEEWTAFGAAPSPEDN